MATKIKLCTCKHKFQDERYGKGMRLFNSMHPAASQEIVGWRCTVCSKTIEDKRGKVLQNLR